MSRFLPALGALLLLATSAPPASASLSISTKPTKNMTCSAGVCTATSKIAVLNVVDLENLLASSDVAVNTAAGADTIQIAAPFAWSSTQRLTLNADLDVRVGAAVAVQGTGGLAINYNNTTGVLLFSGGKVDFWDTSSNLVVNGSSYVLVNDLATLAGDVAANQSGFYAFAKDYDAGPDGTYEDGITDVGFEGSLEGLGHTISNLSIHGGAVTAVGMFEQAGGNVLATLRDLNLANVNVQASGGASVGALVGYGLANIIGVSSSGTVNCGASAKCGGLIGFSLSNSDVSNSTSSVSVTAGVDSTAGGLVGFSEGGIRYSEASGDVFGVRKSNIGGLAGIGQGAFESFATGSVRSNGAVNAGGLFGSVTPSTVILDCYAMGAVQAGNESRIGGFIGNDNEGSIRATYSIGAVSLAGQAPAKTRIGGFAGKFGSGGMLGSDYWDVDTSGQDAACDKGCTGFIGLSDAALKSGLPDGFDPGVWAESASVNGGYPYLIANPPQ